MWTLLQDLDHGPQALPKGSRVTLVNDHEDLPVLGECRRTACRGQLSHTRGAQCASARRSSGVGYR